MSKRAQVLEQSLVGVEVTPGTAVAAANRLLAIGISSKPVVPIQMTRAVGSKFNDEPQVGKGHTEATFEGPLSFNEIGYFLQTILPGSGTYKPAAYTEDVVKTLTVECGQAARAERFTYAMATGIRFRFTQEEISVSGEMFGREREEGIALTSAADIAKVLANPKNVDLYLGESVGGLTLVQGKAPEGEVSISDARGMWKAFDSAQPSFSDVVTKQMKLSAQIVTEYESAAAGYMADLKTASKRFLRWLVQRTVGGVDYSFQITFPFRFTDAEPGETDDVHAATFSLEPCYDSDFGSAIEIVVVNS